MEDKQYLDEAGLSEVGKVISKFYASKDEIKDLDSLKDFVSSHSEIKLHYITKEEYDKMREDDNLPLLVDIYDPIAIVGIEPPTDNYNVWGDDPWGGLWEAGLAPEKHYVDGQFYLLFNITPNHKIVNGRVDSVQFNDTSLKDNNVRLQLAFGERDCCVCWRLLCEGQDYVNWKYVIDPYSTQRVYNIYDEYIKLFRQMENKVDKVSGKGLSTNDYTNEDKYKLDSIDVKYIMDAIQKANVEKLPFKVCNFWEEANSKGKNMPDGWYADNQGDLSMYSVQTPRYNIENKTIYQLRYDALNGFLLETYVWSEEEQNFISQGYSLMMYTYTTLEKMTENVQSTKEEIAQLKSQIEKLQTTINSKE